MAKHARNARSEWCNENKKVKSASPETSKHTRIRILLLMLIQPHTNNENQGLPW